jgi:hypothetical protein
MALQGRLGDFTPADVFRLVALSGKTGVLNLSSDGLHGSVWFRRGQVFFARSEQQRELLGQRLVAAERITPTQLARALEVLLGEREGRRLGEIMVDEGMISHETLEQFVQEQIQDTVFDMLGWETGEFAFEPLAAPPMVEDIGLSVSVENLVMEAARRLREKQQGGEQSAMAGVVYRLSPVPGTGKVDITLTPDEWRMLVLCDGHRTVSEVTSATGFEFFDVSRALRGLFNAGLLELIDADGNGKRSEAPAVPDYAAEVFAEFSSEAESELDDEGEERVTPVQVLAPVEAPPEDLVEEQPDLAAEPATAPVPEPESEPQLEPVAEIRAEPEPEPEVHEAPVPVPEFPEQPESQPEEPATPAEPEPEAGDMPEPESEEIQAEEFRYAAVQNLSERYATEEETPSASLWSGLGDELTALTGGPSHMRKKVKQEKERKEAEAAASADVSIKRDKSIARSTVEAILKGLERK